MHMCKALNIQLNRLSEGIEYLHSALGSLGQKVDGFAFLFLLFTQVTYGGGGLPSPTAFSSVPLPNALVCLDTQFHSRLSFRFFQPTKFVWSTHYASGTVPGAGDTEESITKGQYQFSSYPTESVCIMISLGDFLAMNRTASSVPGWGAVGVVCRKYRAGICPLGTSISLEETNVSHTYEPK